MENLEAYGISGIIVTVITGIGWLIKRYFAERDKQREEIKKAIADLNKDVDNMQSIIISCDNPDCKAKKVLGEYIKNRRNTTTIIN